MNHYNPFLFCLLTFVLSLATAGAQQTNNVPTEAAVPLPRLRAEGQKFVGPDGTPVKLNGVNLGNWLLVEPGVFGGGMGQFPDQYTLFKTLRDRFGEREGNRLIEVYRDNFITERDFAEARRFNINLLRVGFDYSVFEDDAQPMQLRENAFRHTDKALQLAEKYGMYVLFDLHGAQEQQIAGRQSGRANHNRFWKDPKAQERSLWLWQQIVTRYKGRTNVLGYEALNEPWGGGQKALRDYCLTWYKTVRPLDPETILVLPGGKNEISFYGVPSENGWENVAFDMHFYPGLFGQGTQGPDIHRTFLTEDMKTWRATMSRMNAPLIIGETKVVYRGPGTAEMTRRYLDAYSAEGWAMIQWTWKELSPQSASPTSRWMLATNAQDWPALDLRTSTQQEIEAFFRSLSTMPLRFDEEMRHWLTTAEKPSPLEPAAPAPPVVTPAAAPGKPSEPVFADGEQVEVAYRD
ncbi:MAG: glycoside hydrolase family 5 protein, partial [Armatimonadota bacterium]|nr:glycoside hydrolase family 5 protein [Armatimonadota bacterium]